MTGPGRLRPREAERLLVQIAAQCQIAMDALGRGDKGDARRAVLLMWSDVESLGDRALEEW